MVEKNSRKKNLFSFKNPFSVTRLGALFLAGVINGFVMSQFMRPKITPPVPLKIPSSPQSIDENPIIGPMFLTEEQAEYPKPKKILDDPSRYGTYDDPNYNPYDDPQVYFPHIMYDINQDGLKDLIYCYDQDPPIGQEVFYLDRRSVMIDKRRGGYLDNNMTFVSMCKIPQKSESVTNRSISVGDYNGDGEIDVRVTDTLKYRFHPLVRDYSTGFKLRGKK